MGHFAEFVGTFGEVLGDLGHDLRGNVDGFGFSGLEEWWGSEVIGEKSSCFSEDWWDEFEFFSLFVESGSFFTSLVGGFVHNLLEFFLFHEFSGSLGILLVSLWVQVIKGCLEFGVLLFSLGYLVGKTSEVIITSSLELFVVGIVFLLVSNVSVFDGVEHVEEMIKGFTGVQLDGDGIEKGFTQFGLFNGFELSEVGCKCSSDKGN